MKTLDWWSDLRLLPILRTNMSGWKATYNSWGFTYCKGCSLCSDDLELRRETEKEKRGNKEEKLGGRGSGYNEAPHQTRKETHNGAYILRSPRFNRAPGLLGARSGPVRNIPIII